MYLAFERICIYKPVTSRPANSERYIICDNMKPCKQIIQDYMSEINKRLFSTFCDRSNGSDITSIVPLAILKSNAQFYDYIKESNEKLGNVQILNLKKIQAFATNPNLLDIRQADIRDECLKLWKVPLDSRMNIKLSSGYSLNYENKQRHPNQNHRNMKFILNPDDVFRKLNNELKNSKVFIQKIS
jgi:cap1 methyltransferase